jgi:hypothetical protein
MVAAAVAMALMVVPAAGCTEDEEPAAVESHTTTGKRPVEDAGDPTSGPDSSNGGASGSTTPAAAPDEVLGTVRADLSSAPRPSVLETRVLPMRLDVVGLGRNGDLVEVELVLTNELAAQTTSTTVDPSTNPEAFRVGMRFGVTATSDDLSGVSLVGDDAADTYHSAVDDQGRCLCTRNLLTVQVLPGESVDLAVTIEGVPIDVTVLDVHVPGLPPVADVPVS